MNPSFNRKIVESHDGILIIVGADVFFDTEALKIVVSRLLSDHCLGAVCANRQQLIVDQAVENRFRSG
jgi:hypothetical protein